jgi:hypothetical protein
VRRSTRNTRFQGFKSKNLSEAKHVVSKVKPRKTPTMREVNSQTGDSSSTASKMMDIPATPVPVIQSIGINLCGVPPEELSPEKLLATSKNKTEA